MDWLYWKSLSATVLACVLIISILAGMAWLLGAYLVAILGLILLGLYGRETLAAAAEPSSGPGRPSRIRTTIRPFAWIARNGSSGRRG